MSFSSAKDANGSSNREAKGFSLLVIAICTPFLIQYGYRYFFVKEHSPDLEISYIDESCEPFYKQPLISSPKTFLSYPKKKKEAQPVNINTADSIELEKLPGIGFKLAARIIKYRKMLGGYIKVEQLKEVYGIPEETYEKIKSICIVSSKEVIKISSDSLWNKPYKLYHPYMSKDLKQAIVTASKREKYNPELLRELIRTTNDKLLWYINF